MKRKIIKIDEKKCTGCGLCIPDCPEGALQIIDGKARLISDLFCDGLGACLGSCPEDAIITEEREAEAYDEKKVMENIVKAGANTIKAHLLHLENHGETKYLKQAVEYLKQEGIPVPEYKEKSGCEAGVCPGSRIVDSRDTVENEESEAAVSGIKSKLRQWPVQLALLNPSAPYFSDCDLLVAADCTPFAFPDFHRSFLKGKALVIFCPKLDSELERYVEKLSLIIKNNDIKSITVLRMEVPCCGGVGMITEKAIERSGKKIKVKEQVISLQGELL